MLYVKDSAVLGKRDFGIYQHEESKKYSVPESHREVLC